MKGMKGYSPLLLLVLLPMFLFVEPGRVLHAQAPGPQALITWEAHTYTPSWYEGKVLPTGNSEILVAVDLVDRNRFVDLSNQPIVWSVNGNPIREGRGLTRASFQVPSPIGGGAVEIRVQLPGYPGGDVSGNTILIPVSSPEVVIEGPVGQVRNRTFSFRGIPFFFNTDSLESLLFSWTANGIPATEEGELDLLRVSLEPDVEVGAEIRVNVVVENPFSRFERVSKESSVIFEP